MTQVERNYGLDFLKALGLVLIILAHVSAPKMVMQIRNFDVPMMVFLSGYLSRGSFARSQGYLSYFRKRCFRLLVPTYVFLVFLFTFLSICVHVPDFFVVLKTFLLQNDSIGYVWIIRVYLMCAAIVPFISRVDFSRRVYWLAIMIVYGLYELFCELEIGMSFRLIESLLFYIIPYGIILIIGMNYERFSKRKKIFLAIAFSVIFFFFEIGCLTYSGKYCFVQLYKYPPRHIYLVHAMMYISVLMLFIRSFYGMGKNKIIAFISKSSLWIYLWHIFVLIVVKGLLNSFSWPIKFICVLSLSVIIVYFQNRIIDCLEGVLPREVLKIFRG